VNAVEVQQVNILGVRVSAINMSLALNAIAKWTDSDDRNFVCVTGVHGVMESYRDPTLRNVHNAAGLVTPDGMPLVWLGRMMGFAQMDRVYGPDLMLAVCDWSVGKGYSHFFYGGAPQVPEKLAEELTDRFPGLKVAGTYSPPFRELTPDEDTRIIEMINASDAQIVWIGISTPKQELWMSSHLERLRVPVLIGVGAAFDIHSGLKPQAPIWMRHSGLEWLFRLTTEPRRLWKRYAKNNPAFVALAARQLLGWGPQNSEYEP
jgi:N-acetylglucosaminyldiphosphoundecaprenol N-acetyl-beta-D-mannosaminyltransferase